MKKLTVFILLFIVIACLYILYYYPLKKNNQDVNKKFFVALQDNRFVVNNRDFYPVALNYIVTMQSDGHTLWPCTYNGYSQVFTNRFITKDSCLLQLQANMELIKKMGFNTVRLVNIGEIHIEDKKTGMLSIRANMHNQKDTTLLLSNDVNYTKYFNAIHDLFDVVNKVGLKVIFLTRVFHEIPTTERHLKKLAEHFKNDTVLMAYDLFNEPLYFDSLERKKEEVYHIVHGWNKILKIHAPNQLSTIGLEGMREVFEWDPNILNVDFISYHPYEYEPEQVRNEIYWYGKYTDKPWIIGETSLPADDDSVCYEVQKEFARKTLQQACNCGAIGYSWWQYKDVKWGNFHSDFMGILNKKTDSSMNKNYFIQGTVKPVAEEFKRFVPTRNTDSCLYLKNYYNYSQHSSFRLKGYLKDGDNKPIQGGVVLAWNQWWSSSYHTVTKKDGSFDLLGNFPFYHWMASATKYSVIRGEISPDTAKTNNDSIPTIYLQTLNIDKLPFVY